MSSPTETSKDAMKGMGRYLIGHKRMVYTYPFQRAVHRHLQRNRLVRVSSHEALNQRWLRDER